MQVVTPKVSTHAPGIWKPAGAVILEAPNTSAAARVANSGRG